MTAVDSKFSNFDDGGVLANDDIVVGLRNGVNTRFTFEGSDSGGGNINNWRTITDPSVTVSSRDGIIANRTVTPLQVVLPDEFSAGDQIGVLGCGAGGWSLVAATGQTIIFGSQETSVSGSIDSDIQNANIYVRGLVDNTTWTVELSNSNPDII